MNKKALVGLLALVAVVGVGVLIRSQSHDGKTFSPEDNERTALDPSNDLARRERAALDLGNGDKDAIPKAREILNKATEPQVKAAAISSLAQLKDWDSMPVLLKLLDDPNEAVRARAGMAVNLMLGRNYGFKANDPPEVRATAAASMREGYRSMGKNNPFTK